MSEIAQKALDIARTQLGVQEEPKGSNAGPKVEQYLSSVGLGKGNPWCMAFVYWCYTQAASNLKSVNTLIKTGGVLQQWMSVDVKKKVAIPQAGDIFIMRFAHGTGHTGFVEQVVGGIAITIEGNTNEDGSREGYEVARRRRPLTSIIGYIRP